MTPRYRITATLPDGETIVREGEGYTSREHAARALRETEGSREWRGVSYLFERNGEPFGNVLSDHRDALAEELLKQMAGLLTSEWQPTTTLAWRLSGTVRGLSASRWLALSLLLVLQRRNLASRDEGRSGSYVWRATAGTALLAEARS